MAKRFTDSDKWKDAWYRKLPPVFKCLWQFLVDECDCAGVWRVDFESVAFHIGEEIDREAALAAMGDRIAVLPGGGRWHIRKFVEFQYGPVPNPKNNAHKGVLRALDRHSLSWESSPSLAPAQPLPSPCQGPLRGAQDKEQEKDKDKDSISDAEIDRVLGAVEASNAQPLVPPATQPHTLGDFQAMHTPPVLLRPVDQDQARALFVLYGWDCWSAAHACVSAIARKERRRVYLSEIQDWLTANAELEPTDYTRAGLPVPAGKG